MTDFLARSLSKAAGRCLGELLDQRQVEASVDAYVKGLCASGAWIDEVELNADGSYGSIVYSFLMQAFVVTLPVGP